jgi:hypothetical protein
MLRRQQQGRLSLERLLVDDLLNKLFDGLGAAALGVPAGGVDRRRVALQREDDRDQHVQMSCGWCARHAMVGVSGRLCSGAEAQGAPWLNGLTRRPMEGGAAAVEGDEAGHLRALLQHLHARSAKPRQEPQCRVCRRSSTISSPLRGLRRDSCRGPNPSPESPRTPDCQAPKLLDQGSLRFHRGLGFLSSPSFDVHVGHF